MRNSSSQFSDLIIYQVFIHFKNLFMNEIGTVKPIYGLLPGDATFKLWFTSGGCQTFLNCFCRVMDQVRKGGQKGPDNRFIEQVRLGQFAGQKGFVDPNDPSVIYVSQPTETYSNV